MSVVEAERSQQKSHGHAQRYDPAPGPDRLGCCPGRRTTREAGRTSGHRGIFARLNYDLTGLARIKQRRKPEPTTCVIDTQSVKTSTNIPLASQGIDAAKKIVGRKRGIVTDTLGLILAVIVTAASLSENAVGVRLLDHVI